MTTILFQPQCMRDKIIKDPYETLTGSVRYLVVFYSSVIFQTNHVWYNLMCLIQNIHINKRISTSTEGIIFDFVSLGTWTTRGEVGWRRGGVLSYSHYLIRSAESFFRCTDNMWKEYAKQISTNSHCVLHFITKWYCGLLCCSVISHFIITIAKYVKHNWYSCTIECRYNTYNLATIMT